MIFGNAVQDYYLSEARRLSAARKERLAAISTRREAEAYAAEVREKICRAFKLPADRCAPQTTVTGERQSGGIAIRNIIYYSRPGFPVTAMLYLPRRTGKLPAVLMLCGHSEEGKGAETYQTVCLNLADQGFAVLAVDPVSQGERHQFLAFGDDGAAPHNCCCEHNMEGKQLIPTGEFFGAWRAWDAICGIDCLLSLPEIDPRRLGITGNSGGGTMTTFVNALDDRLTMAAPGCYVTTWLHNIENELPADIEQIPPGLFGAGLEMADFIIARAPRPTLIMGQKNDFFDPRGTREAYEEIRRIYRLLGAEDSLRLFIGPDSHGYTRPNREAMYTFFGRHATGVETAGIKENDSLSPLPLPATWCAPQGECDNLPGPVRHVRDINSEIADKMTAARPRLNRTQLRQYLLKALQPGEISVPYRRTLRPGHIPDGKYADFARFGLETEPGRVMCVLKLYDGFWFHIPACEEAVLYIPHLDADAEAPSVPLEAGQKLFALDPRGLGETTPAGCDQNNRDFFGQYLFDYHYNSLGFLLGRPYLGGRVRDVMCALELLRESGVKRIILRAEGQGTVPALLASFLSGIPAHTVLHDGPRSWNDIVHKPYTLWPASCLLPGALACTDLDELRSMTDNLTATFADEPRMK